MDTLHYKDVLVVKLHHLAFKELLSLLEVKAWDLHFLAVKEGIELLLTKNGIIGSILYGGFVEEVMLRLFFMSLIAFAIWKLFFKDRYKYSIPTAVLVIANIVAALAFAAAHLPATMVTFGELTPIILIRCFLYNGGLGLLFGWLYRKYGIAYAMMGHALCHIVSKVVWFIFI